MLVGKFINIRPVRKNDLEKIFQWSKNNEDSYFLLEGIGQSSFSELQILFEEGNKKDELIMETKEGSPFGLLKFQSIDRKARKAAFFFSICEKKLLNSEHSFEAIKMLVEYIFEEENLQRLYTYLLEYEKEHMTLLNKLKFAKEAILREEFYHMGKYYDLHVFGLLRDEFTKLFKNKKHTRSRKSK